MEICTTDYLRHTAEMAVVETLWQLHTLSVINSWFLLIGAIYSASYIFRIWMNISFIKLYEC